MFNLVSSQRPALLFPFVFLLSLLLCSCAKYSGNQNIKLDNTQFEFVELTNSGREVSIYELKPEGKEQLEAIINSNPDVRTSSVGLIGICTILVDGTKYAIQDNEIIAMPPGKAIIWQRKGIRQRILNQSELIEKKTILWEKKEH